MNTDTPRTETKLHPLTELVLKHYLPIETTFDQDGAQLWDGQWLMPCSGCDTLDHLMADVADLMERELNAANKRIKRLEEAGDMLAVDSQVQWGDTMSVIAWKAAKAPTTHP